MYIYIVFRLPGDVKIKQEKITDSMPVKKKRDRFKGMTEEEVAKKTLPDLICPNLDILIVSLFIFSILLYL